MYKRLSTHPNILRYYETNEHGLVLEHAPKGDVRGYIRALPGIPMKQRITWCRELCEAIVHIHSKGVHHVKISAANVLLDDSLCSKLANFQRRIKDPNTEAILIESKIEDEAMWLTPLKYRKHSEKSYSPFLPPSLSSLALTSCF